MPYITQSLLLLVSYIAVGSQANAYSCDMVQLPETENSFWRRFYPAIPVYPTLHGTVQVDVAVVGAGITGLTTAYLLKNAGLKVAVLEKHTVGGGTTGRTTGKVTSQHGIFYQHFQKNAGRKAAELYGEANQYAIQLIEKIITQESISCDWSRQDNYVFTNEEERLQEFKVEAAIASDLGLPATFETDTPLPFSVKGAVKFANQAKINSLKYVLGLANAIQANGGQIFENSTVIGIHEGTPGNIRTRGGHVLARHIVVASSVPTLPLFARVAYGINEYPSESYLVAGKFDQDLPGMYISPDKHHYSILPVALDGQRILFIGGEGHLWGLRGNRHARFERLANYAESYFGVQDFINRWSDRDYLAYDHAPLAGKLYPWSKRLYVGTAFKKWGLTSGTVAAMILADTILGNDNAWKEVFDSMRLSLLRGIRI